MRVEYSETTSRHIGRYVSTAETEVGVGRKQRVFQDHRVVVVGPSRFRRKIGSANRAVRRERAGDHFINSNTGPGYGAIESSDNTRRIAGAWSLSQGGLLHAASELTQSHWFEHIAYTAAEFALRIRAPGSQHTYQGKSS
jgi:hypothetical protein